MMSQYLWSIMLATSDSYLPQLQKEARELFVLSAVLHGQCWEVWSHFPYWLLSNSVKSMYKAEALGGVCGGACACSGRAAEWSGKKSRLVDFVLTKRSWQVRLRRTLSFRGNKEEIAVLLNCGEQGRKHLNITTAEEDQVLFKTVPREQ